MTASHLIAAFALCTVVQVAAQTTGNIAVFKQSETRKFTELRADIEEVGTVKRGVRTSSYSATILRYVIYDITNGKTAVVAYNPSYLVLDLGRLVKRKFYWIESAPADVFAYTRLPLPLAGTEQWLSVGGEELVHETSPGNSGLNTDSVNGVETWGLLGKVSHLSGKATPFVFSDGFTAPVPRSIAIRGLNVSQEFRYRHTIILDVDRPDLAKSYSYLTHTTNPITGTLTLDVATTGKANKEDTVVVGNPVVQKRTIENGVEKVIAALKKQGFAPRP